MGEINKTVDWVQVALKLEKFTSSIDEQADLGLMLLTIGMIIFVSCIITNFDDQELINQ